MVDICKMLTNISAIPSRKFLKSGKKKEREEKKRKQDRKEKEL